MLTSRLFVRKRPLIGIRCHCFKDTLQFSTNFSGEYTRRFQSSRSVDGSLNNEQTTTNGGTEESSGRIRASKGWGKPSPIVKGSNTTGKPNQMMTQKISSFFTSQRDTAQKRSATQQHQSHQEENTPKRATNFSNRISQIRQDTARGPMANSTDDIRKSFGRMPTTSVAQSQLSSDRRNPSNSNFESKNQQPGYREPNYHRNSHHISRRSKPSLSKFSISSDYQSSRVLDNKLSRISSRQSQTNKDTIASPSKTLQTMRERLKTTVDIRSQHNHRRGQYSRGQPNAPRNDTSHQSNRNLESNQNFLNALHGKAAPNQSFEKTSQSKYDSNSLASPITELIFDMQKRNSAKRLKEKESEKSEKPAVKQIPKWRANVAQKEKDNAMRNSNHTPNFGRRYPQRSSSDPVLPGTSHRPDYANLKQSIVALPQHSLSLSEASQLFRTKTTFLVSILQSMGEVAPTIASTGEPDLKSWMLSPETVEVLAMSLDVSYELDEAPDIAPDDEAILLQRRAQMEETSKSAQSDTTIEEQASLAAYDSFPSRPPVVCVMGHVDHGKTTLMDALRRRATDGEKVSTTGKKAKKKKKKGSTKTEKGGDIAGTEAGGITQVVTAFQIPLADDSAVTFLDTPGHSAFSAMRQSGLDAADVIVLVVAADDGVSKQTIEVLNFYKTMVKEAGIGGISMVVALNKIDKPGVDIDESTMKIQGQLLEHGILTEGMPSESGENEFGPPIQMIPVSGLTGEGLDDLIDGLALQSEIMNLRADTNSPAEGIVMDSRVEKGLGIVVDIIIRWGTIKKGDALVSGKNIGKVKILKDSNNKQIKEGSPSQPVRVVGFESTPKAGEPFIVAKSEENAKLIVSDREGRAAAAVSHTPTKKTGLELQSAGKHMMSKTWKAALEKKHGIVPEEADADACTRIPVILKADADGTLAALRDSLTQLCSESSQNLRIDVVKTGVGPLLVSEVEIAKDCDAAVVCFNLKNELAATSMANNNDVPLLQSDVIYRILEQAKLEFAKSLPAEIVTVVHGRAQVQAIFDIGGISEKVAGLQVIEGTLYKEKVTQDSTTTLCTYRVLREGIPIQEGNPKSTSLKHFKDDVDSVKFGKDCGLSISGHNDYQEGDIVECISIEKQTPLI